MKKVILFAALSLTLGFAANAQTFIIPKAGAVFSNYKSSGSGIEGRTGFVGGLGLSIPVTSDNFFAIQPELLYIQKGAKFNTNLSTTRVRRYVY